MTTPQLLPDATCLACGCSCDDVELAVADNRVVAAHRVCATGEQWFLLPRPTDVPVCLIEGRPGSLEAGCKRAATILKQARSPLVFGLAAATCEAQRAAVVLARRLGGTVEAAGHIGAALDEAVQAVGMVTATLGEVRHRAELVVFWRVDPATTHPRHFERYSLTCAGEFVPRGRADRTCIVVDSRRTPTADEADLYIETPATGDAEVLESLGRAAAGDDEAVSRPWSQLIDRIKAARYAAIFFQPTEATRPLVSFVRQMNRHTRLVALPLGSPGNPAGARQVLAWQTGFARAACFATGRPQAVVEHGGAAERMAAAAADAALVVACDPLADPLATLAEPARARLAEIPTIVLQTADAQPSIAATVTFTVATPGIDAAGTVFRSDGVALPLRPATRSPYPAASELLLTIARCLKLGSP